MLKNVLILFLFFSSILFSQTEKITVISWNIKDFGKTKNSEELDKMAELVKHADIIAIQEVVAGYGGPQAVAKLADLLNRKGAKWDYIVSNPTVSSKYMLERYAFIWKNKHIKIKNRGRLLSELQDQIEREPLMVDFYLKGKKFSILNYHSIPNKKNPRPEIEALTKYIIDDQSTPLLLVGDFNVSEDDPIFCSFLEHGYSPSITNTRTTIKRKCDNSEYLNYNIDNIYYSKDIFKINSDIIDFVFVCDEIENARKISDHLPVYLTFKMIM